MEPLATEQKKHGYDYFFIKREGDIAMYSQFDGDHLIGYEVFRVKQAKETTWPNGTVSPERELFPSDSDFGATAYSATSLEFAEKLFEDLKNKSAGIIDPTTSKRKRQSQPGTKKLIVGDAKITLYPDNKMVCMCNGKLLSPKKALFEFLTNKKVKNIDDLTAKQMVEIIKTKFADSLVE